MTDADAQWEAVARMAYADVPGAGPEPPSPAQVDAGRVVDLAGTADDAAWLAAPLSPAEAASIVASEDGTDPLVPWPDEDELLADVTPCTLCDRKTPTPGLCRGCRERLGVVRPVPAEEWPFAVLPTAERAHSRGPWSAPGVLQPRRVLVTLRWTEREGRKERQRQQVRLGTVVERGPDVVIVDVPGCGVVRCWPSDVEDAMGARS